MFILYVLCAVVLLAALALFVRHAAGGRQSPLLTLPSDYGLAAEEAFFRAEDGVRLEGWFIPCFGADKTIVLCHGFDMNKGDILKRTHYLAAKYNLFYFDFRGSGNSSGRSAIGLDESRDLRAAVAYLKEKYPAQCREIALYGLCMGAAVASYYTATCGGVKCLLLESAYYSFKNVAKRWAWSHVRVPYFPLVSSFLFVQEKKRGKKVESFALKETAGKITCPVLIVQGERDRLAPVKKARKIYDALRGPKELWVVPDCGHTSCAKAGGAAYQNKIQSFFEQNF